MRQVTRRFLVGVGLVIVALLALGALPQFLGSGDSYYLTATPTNESGPAVTVTDPSERRFPYLSTALRDGRSDGYQRGPFGFKESFTHSPFDEYDSLVARNPDARIDGPAEQIRIVVDGQYYLVEVTT